VANVRGAPSKETRCGVEALLLFGGVNPWVSGAPVTTLGLLDGEGSARDSMAVVAVVKGRSCRAGVEEDGMVWCRMRFVCVEDTIGPGRAVSLSEDVLSVPMVVLAVLVLGSEAATCAKWV